MNYTVLKFMHLRASLFVIAAFFCAGCSKQTVPGDSFNIVLITIDTLRADHLSCYGYERETSPYIDSIAQQGILFKNCIAPSSWTAPSMVSLFTSTYPVSHGVIHGLAFQKAKGFRQEVFSENLITLPALLKKHGYTTFGASSNHHLTAEFGFARGFDYFKYLKWQPAQQINDIVYSWSDAIKEADRFFLWVHYIDPHHPYYPKSPWIEQYSSAQPTHLKELSRKKNHELTPQVKEKPELLTDIIALYDSEINYVDFCIGKLIERFDLDKNTLLIITSDHGEQFMEHGKIGHAINLHKEELHVPLIIKLPDVSKMRSISRQVSLIDIMPTILELLDLDHPEQTAGTPLLKGRGIAARLKEAVPGRHAVPTFFAELESNAILKTIITPPWKYIYDYRRKSGELYNIISDPSEQTNLIDEHTERADNLREHLFSWAAQARKIPPKSHFFQLSPEEQEKLAVLGYLTPQEEMEGEEQDEQDDDRDGVINAQDNCVD